MARETEETILHNTDPEGQEPEQPVREETDTQTEQQQEPAEEPLEEEEPTKAQKLVKKVKGSEKSVKNYQFFILKLVLIILVLWILFFKLIGLTHMPNGDMYPRIDSGDMVMFYRLDKDVKAQDIIIFEKTTPDSPTKKGLFVLRVVAVAGDTVEITEAGRLIINGNSMIENNIFYPTYGYEGYTEYPLTLGPDECFVLADSREGGTDSRYFGPVKKSEIIGTVISLFRRHNL